MTWPQAMALCGSGTGWKSLERSWKMFGNWKLAESSRRRRISLLPEYLAVLMANVWQGSTGLDLQNMGRH